MLIVISGLLIRIYLHNLTRRTIASTFKGSCCHAKYLSFPIYYFQWNFKFLTLHPSLLPSKGHNFYITFSPSSWVCIQYLQPSYCLWVLTSKILLFFTINGLLLQKGYDNNPHFHQIVHNLPFVVWNLKLKLLR